jgi:hypothetical protein
LKITEIILVLIWVSFFLLLGVDFPGMNQFFYLATVLLGVFYLIGSHKLFGQGKTTSPLITILAGVALASSLITLPHNIWLQFELWLQILPLINISFTVFLIGLICFNRIKKSNNPDYFKPILFRTVPVLLVTCFFAYPISSLPSYRNIMIHLNQNNGYLLNNVKMVDFNVRAREQLESGNCELSIELAKESFYEGLKWLGIQENSITEKEMAYLWKIQGTYTSIYEAYECKASKLYDAGKAKDALVNYIKADSFININPASYNDWERRLRAQSKNNIGLSYDQLNQYDSASIYFSKAIKYHIDSIGKMNTDLAIYFNNMAETLSEGRYWNESSQIALKSIIVLDKDSISENKNKQYARSYLLLAFNAAVENEYIKAKEYLTLSEKYLTPVQTCKYYLYSSALYLKLGNSSQSINYARQAKACYSDNFDERFQNVAESEKMLFEAWIHVPNYDSAFKSIRNGIDITKANVGENSTRFLTFLEKEAYYYYITGSYKESLTRYLDISKGYEEAFGSDSYRLSEVLISIGKVKIELGDKSKALHYANEGLRIAELHDFFYNDKATDILNDVAYIKYATGQDLVADSLYNKSIRLSTQMGNDSSLSVASAINGLGLISMKDSDLAKADSLFELSLNIYQQRLQGLHPDKGIVLMNKSQLSIKKKSYDEALIHIEGALNNFVPFNRKNHPNIADMYLIKAFVFGTMDKLEQANDLCEKALEIYGQNFDPDHPKIKEARRMLDLLK